MVEAKTVIIISESIKPNILLLWFENIECVLSRVDKNKIRKTKHTIKAKIHDHIPEDKTLPKIKSFLLMGLDRMESSSCFLQLIIPTSEPKPAHNTKTNCNKYIIQVSDKT
jgi:hypothetical protein